MPRACQVCQNELDDNAFAGGGAILAKGQPVCASCAGRLGIPQDKPSALPQPRSPTEALPVRDAPMERKDTRGLPTFLAIATLLALAGLGWAHYRTVANVADLRTRMDTPPPTPTPTEVRRELAEQLKELERKLSETTKALTALREQQDRQDAAVRDLSALASVLRDEARRAREEAVAARAASEGAARSLAQETAAAVERALNDRLARGEPAPAQTPTAAPDLLAEQYWANAQSRAQDLARQGRYAVALREYDRIPKNHRKPDFDQRLKETSTAYERQAMERVDLVFRNLEPRLSAGDYADAEALLLQVAEDCAFPAVLDRLKPKIDEIHTLRKAQARREEETALREKSRLLKGLLLDLAQADPAIQKRAVDALKTLGTEATAPLVQALEDPKPAVRWGALMALGGIKTPDAVVPVAKRLKDADPKIRLTAADVLSEFDDLRGVPDLIEALSDIDEGVAKQAELTLERITHFVPPAKAEKPADNAPAWRTWWESGRRKATEP